MHCKRQQHFVHASQFLLLATAVWQWQQLLRYVGGCSVCAPAIYSFSLSLWNDIIYPSSLPKKINCAFELKLSCTHPLFDKKQQILKIHWQKGWAGWQGGAATIAGEKSVRVFMVAIQRATSNVALVQQVWKCLPYPSRALILIIANRVGPLQLQIDDPMPWSSLLITEITWLTMNYYRIDKLLFFSFFLFLMKLLIHMCLQSGQHFMNTVLRMLLPVDGAHSACCEEMAAAMANTERTALKGLQSCINAMIAEVKCTTLTTASIIWAPLLHAWTRNPKSLAHAWTHWWYLEQ